MGRSIAFHPLSESSGLPLRLIKTQMYSSMSAATLLVIFSFELKKTGDIGLKTLRFYTLKSKRPTSHIFCPAV